MHRHHSRPLSVAIDTLCGIVGLVSFIVALLFAFGLGGTFLISLLEAIIAVT